MGPFQVNPRLLEFPCASSLVPCHCQTSPVPPFITLQKSTHYWFTIAFLTSPSHLNAELFVDLLFVACSHYWCGTFQFFHQPNNYGWTDGRTDDQVVFCFALVGFSSDIMYNALSNHVLMTPRTATPGPRTAPQFRMSAIWSTNGARGSAAAVWTRKKRKFRRCQSSFVGISARSVRFRAHMRDSRSSQKAEVAAATVSRRRVGFIPQKITDEYESCLN